MQSQKVPDVTIPGIQDVPPRGLFRAQRENKRQPQDCTLLSTS